MRATDSSSSAENPNSEPTSGRASELFRLELEDRLPSLPAAFYAGRDLDLLEPIRLWSADADPGETRGEILAPRGDVARALGEANETYGHPRAAELARKLADPATRVVVTGQQPGLFGGPLMALSKTVAALRWADELESRGVPAVAVFWVATEDHDWAEIAKATFLERQDPVELELGEDGEPLRPVGRRLLGEGMSAVAERARELIYGEEAGERLERALGHYDAEKTVGEAFIGLMLEILGERAPLYLDSQLPAIKALQKSMLRAMIERRHELDAAYVEADRAVEERSHPLQVTPQPGVSPLFLEHRAEADGRQRVERRRIEWRGEHGYSLRGLDDFEGEVDELLEILESEPGRVSPGVLARPAIQDALLGTTLQVLGPAELSYMPQARAAHSLLGLEGVYTTLRPQTMVLEKKYAGWLEELDLPLAELLERPLEEALAERKGDDLVQPVLEAIDRELAQLRQAALEVDKSLAKPFDKTRDHIGRGLDTLSSKIAAAVARRHDVWLRRLEQMKNNLEPGGTLQERRLATAFLWCRHGDGLVENLYEQIDLDPRRLSVVRPD